MARHPLHERQHALHELATEVEGISEKMLASTLRTLEADGLVHRESYPEVPPRVEYALTDLGRELMERMLPLVEWVASHAGSTVPPSATTAATA